MAHPMSKGVLLARVGLSLAFRFSCYALMVWLALWAEARPAPGPLPDALLDRIPYVAWVDRHNYVLWLLTYVPVALWLVASDAERFIRYTYTSGLLALARGFTIAATGLGPVSGPDVHAGMSLDARWSAFVSLVNPFWAFDPDGGARVALTKDLFFSGHTATTFLLLLYVWPLRGVRWWMLVGHVLVVASVFLSHLHYTIDVVGAYAVTFALFSLRERRAASPVVAPTWPASPEQMAEPTPEPLVEPNTGVAMEPRSSDSVGL